MYDKEPEITDEEEQELLRLLDDEEFQLLPLPPDFVNNVLARLAIPSDLPLSEASTERKSTGNASIISEGQETAQHDYCFVLMPFTEAHDLQITYRDHVKPVIERCGLRCERAPDINDFNTDLSSVWSEINNACIVVAELTGQNANVLYGLGIAHVLDKPVIMLTQSLEFVPRSMVHIRTIIYTSSQALEQDLENTIKAGLSAAADFESNHRLPIS